MHMWMVILLEQKEITIWQIDERYPVLIAQTGTGHRLTLCQVNFTMFKQEGYDKFCFWLPVICLCEVSLD